ncbi:MAG TPA: hypothetical protein VH415_04020 [Nitrososphaeraceae archaeon]
MHLAGRVPVTSTIVVMVINITRFALLFVLFARIVSISGFGSLMLSYVVGFSANIFDY